jgi:hypothetical protein
MNPTNMNRSSLERTVTPECQFYRSLKDVDSIAPPTSARTAVGTLTGPWAVQRNTGSIPGRDREILLATACRPIEPP